MPRFLRLGNRMIHVPSVTSVTIGTSCFGRPTITIAFHATKDILHVSYSNWDECQKEFTNIKNALTEVESILEKIPLTESEQKKVQVQAQVPMTPDAKELVEIAEKISEERQA